jgi:hypothetical protein
MAAPNPGGSSRGSTSKEVVDGSAGKPSEAAPGFAALVLDDLEFHGSLNPPARVISLFSAAAAALANVWITQQIAIAGPLLSTASSKFILSHIFSLIFAHYGSNL